MSQTDTAAGQAPLPGPQDRRALRDAFGRFATGVALVTAPSGDDGSPIGIIVNSFASVSLDPPLVLWSVAHSSSRYRLFAAAPAFAIHVLRADQADLVQRFGRSGTGFAEAMPQRNPEGVAVLDTCLARFDCTAETRHEAGDHTILLGRVTRFLCASGEPLCFFSGGFGAFAPGA